MTVLKERVTLKILDDKKLEKFLSLTNEIDNKGKALKKLKKEIIKDLKSGLRPHPKSLYEADLLDKEIRFSPQYKDLLFSSLGEDEFNKLIEDEKKKFDKEVKKGIRKPKKDLSVKKK